MRKLILLSFLMALLIIHNKVNAGLFNLGGSSAVEISCVQAPNKKNTNCAAFFSESIETPGSYQSFYKMMLTRQKGDNVYLHLAGNGGEGSGLVYILNAIKASPAKTISIVDGSVASAHAILAVATEETIIVGDSYLLFHNISSSNMHLDLCSQIKGKDRGLSSYEKCMENIGKVNKFYDQVINKHVYKVLTEDERKQYDSGHDIIIFADEMKKRIQKL